LISTEEKSWALTYDENNYPIYYCEAEGAITFASTKEILSEGVPYATDYIETESESLYVIKKGSIQKVCDLVDDKKEELEEFEVVKPGSTSTNKDKDLAVSNQIVALFRMLDDVMDPDRDLKITRIFDKIIVLTNDDDVINKFRRIDKDITIKSSGENKSDFISMTIEFKVIQLSSVLSKIYHMDRTGTPLRETNSNRTDFLDVLATDFNISYDFSDSCITLVAPKKLDAYVKKMLVSHGLHFNKKGVLHIDYEGQAYDCLMKLIKHYFNNIETNMLIQRGVI